MLLSLKKRWDRTAMPHSGTFLRDYGISYPYIWVNRDIAVVEMSDAFRQPSLFYHLGVRESFSMANNIILYCDTNAESLQSLKLEGKSRSNLGEHVQFYSCIEGLNSKTENEGNTELQHMIYLGHKAIVGRTHLVLDSSVPERHGDPGAGPGESNKDD
ncbi:hypothetical protein BTVI_132300 [Pitangus sulphuratus]|nr:hypothetical protein BTVI_132300 [Pitangus sulphuratus]